MRLDCPPAGAVGTWGAAERAESAAGGEYTECTAREALTEAVASSPVVLARGVAGCETNWPHQPQHSQNQPAKRQRHQASGSSSGAPTAAAPFGFEVRLHPSRPSGVALDVREPPRGPPQNVAATPAPASTAQGAGSDEGGGMWVEIAFLPEMSDASDDSAPKPSAAKPLAAFWPFAERVRNDVVRDTRKWRRLEAFAARGVTG